MRGLMLSGFGLLLIFLLSVIFVASASESTSTNAVITDISNVSSTVYNLTISEWVVDTSGRIYAFGSGVPHVWANYHDIVVKKGEATITVDFDRIKSIDFNWLSQNGSAEVTTTSGDVIVMMPISHQSVGFDNWFLRGDTDYGSFKLQLNKTKNIKFS